MLPCLLILRPSEVPKHGIHFNTLGEIQPIVQVVLLMVKCSSECTGLLQGDDLHPEEDQCTLVKSKHGQGFQPVLLAGAKEPFTVHATASCKAPTSSLFII